MTSQRDQIQALIAEIDSVLQRANPRLPWVMSGEVTQQRQVLERVRNYLVSLHQQQTLNKGYATTAKPDFLSQDLYYQPSQAPTRSPAFEPTPAPDQTTQQMLDRVLQEIAQLRVSLTPPNQSPLSAELLQVLINRLQERLSQQIAQALQPGGGSMPPRSDYMLAAGTPSSTLSTSQYEQLQALRTRSDQMLVNLDSTINIVFESLQRNIQTYQDSLSQGLDRMYSLGQQSEITFKALVELLIKQLQQEFAAASVAPSQPSLPAPPAVPSFPYAGAETPSSDLSQTDLTTPAIPPVPRSPQAELSDHDALSAWLSLAGTQNQPVNQPAPSTAQNTAPSLDLSQLNLDETLSFATSPVSPVEDIAADAPAAAIEEEDTTEIDAALKLLENLSAELQTAASPISLEDAEDHLNDLIRETPIATESVSLPEIPQDVRLELDDFYQSLFGESEAATASTLPPLPTPDAAEPVATTAAEFEFPAATEEIFLDNVFEETPPLPPAPSSESLFDDFFELEESPTKPDLESPEPPAIAPEEVRFTQLDQISSLADLFDTVGVEQDRSTPIEPPGSASLPSAPLIEAPFEQTYNELLQREAPQPVELPSPQVQDFGVADDFLEEEQYTKAAFDENLLPDAPVQMVDLTLDVDDITLSSLSEDLANLENTPYESPYPLGSGAAIAQPVPPAQPTAAFTLDDFATDLSQPSQPDAEPDELSLEDFAAAIAPPPATSSASTDEPSLEDFAAAIAPPPATSSASSDDLFANFSEPVSSAVEALSKDYTSPFTLEGMDDLFEDAPAISSPANSLPTTTGEKAPGQEDSSSAPLDLGWDDAFESILGPINTPISADETPPQPPLNSEKKKT